MSNEVVEVIVEEQPIIEVERVHEEEEVPIAVVNNEVSLREILGNPKITFVLGKINTLLYLKVVLPPAKEPNAQSLSRSSVTRTSPLATS